MEEKHKKIYDCSRGCTIERSEQGELLCTYEPGCCKLKDFNWLSDISASRLSNNIYEVRFKNTRKGFYENTSGQRLKNGDLVVVEAATGYDLGIITLEDSLVIRQMLKNRIDPENTEFRKIYRKARPLDLEKWQEAIAREQDTMIRARQIAADLKLEMKIGDVEFQGDGTKAIFYYIAEERVDFRQLIKVLAEAFHIRIEMKQIGARQEAGLIGGIGVCGRELCCARYITNFSSITTSSARVQDLSLNPQKLAGQCAKLKCCINYEVPVYLDAQSKLPRINAPLEFADGQAFLVKSDVLKGILWFSFDEHNAAKMFPLTAEEVRQIKAANDKGLKPEYKGASSKDESAIEFISAAGDDKIDRFDKKKKKKNNNNRRKQRPQPQKEQHSKPAKTPEESK